MSRRYSKQARNRVRDFVELQITDYHSNRRALADYHAQSIPSAVPKYGGTGGGHGGDSRPTELIGVRMASDQYIEHLTRSVAAVGAVLSRLSPEDRRLVRLRYWRRGYTVERAAQELYLSKSAAYRKLNAITTAVARELGYISFDRLG